MQKGAGGDWELPAGTVGGPTSTYTLPTIPVGAFYFLHTCQLTVQPASRYSVIDRTLRELAELRRHTVDETHVN